MNTYEENRTRIVNKIKELKKLILNEKKSFPYCRNNGRASMDSNGEEASSRWRIYQAGQGPR